MAVPAAPTALSATPGDNSASIAFTQSAATPAVTNYKYAVNGGAYKALVPADAATPITIPNLVNGVVSTITLKAVNSDGDSAASAGVTVTPVDSSTANNNGWSDANSFANPGLPVPHKDWADPDD